MKEQKNSKLKEAFNVPNILTYIRFALIPVIVWLYIVEKEPLWTFGVVMLSAATDIIDGKIARHFHLVSDLGKAIDPVADKLTQLVTLICMIYYFPNLLILLAVMLVKEVLSAVMSLLAIRKTKTVLSSAWHGKVTTVLLYFSLALHLLWFTIPPVVSNVLILLCTSVMLLSAVLYMKRNIGLLKGKGA